MKSFPLLLPLLMAIYLALGPIAIVEPTGKTTPGPWEPINHMDNHLQEMARFAVFEHDKDTNTRLALTKVLKADAQAVMSGTNYRLILEASNGGAVQKYQALVFEKAFQWADKGWVLISFKPFSSLKM